MWGWGLKTFSFVWSFSGNWKPLGQLGILGNFRAFRTGFTSGKVSLYPPADPPTPLRCSGRTSGLRCRSQSPPQPAAVPGGERDQAGSGGWREPDEGAGPRLGCRPGLSASILKSFSPTFNSSCAEDSRRSRTAVWAPMRRARPVLQEPSWPPGPLTRRTDRAVPERGLPAGSHGERPAGGGRPGPRLPQRAAGSAGLLLVLLGRGGWVRFGPRSGITDQ